MNDPRPEPVPNKLLDQIRSFAKDLAYGALVGDWPPQLGGTNYGELDKGYDALNDYLEKKWHDFRVPDLRILVSTGYAQSHQRTIEHSVGTSNRTVKFTKWTYTLTDKAFTLLEQPSPASIFISYSRGNSSELALLILARFKALGQEPFLDMSIEPGDDWETRLRREVTGRDYFVSLVGPTTLDSEYVRQEIVWALEAGAQIIPIWHRGFGDAQLTAYERDYPDLAPFFNKQAIRVEQENPIAYEGAIIQLLNRFGFTPS